MVCRLTTPYLRCCFCGRSRPIRSIKYPGGVLKLRDMTIDPAEYPIVQIREVIPGPGRGHRVKGHGGWRTVEELSIAEVMEDPAYEELGLQVKERLVAIVRSYVRAGVISLVELSGGGEGGTSPKS